MVSETSASNTYIGRLLAKRYHINGRCGGGGQGQVYRACDIRLERRVAIKVVKHAQFSMASKAQRNQWLKKEAGRLARLGPHSNIAAVHDLGTDLDDDGYPSPFVVMDLLDGPCLREWLRPTDEPSHVLDEYTAMHILMPVIAAIAHAHDKRVVHRDLKPDNLVWHQRGQSTAELVVIDFGLSKVMDSADPLKTSISNSDPFNPTCGTARYKAPEQVLPESYGPVTFATDVHALGLIFVEMVTGKRAYRHPLQATFQQRPSPRQRGARVSDDCERIWARAVALNRADRYPDAGALLADCRVLMNQWQPESLAPATLSTVTVPFSGFDERQSSPTHEPAYTDRATPSDIVRQQSWPAHPKDQPAPPAPRQPAKRPVRRSWLAAIASLATLGVLVGVGVMSGLSADTLSWPKSIALGSPSSSGRRAPAAATPAPTSAATGAATAPIRAPTAPTGPTAQPALGSLVRVGGGEFIYGTALGKGTELPAQRVVLPTFEIHKYEVTVGEYRRCVDARQCEPPNTREGNRCNWSQPERANHPINCVSWQQARTYCHAMGMRLPTEVEWEKAARGVRGHLHSWGRDDPSCQHAVLERDEHGSCNVEGTLPVGSKPMGRSPYGAEDMVGNVWEWTSSKFVNGDRKAALDPAHAVGADSRMLLRGASWGNPHSDAKVTHRLPTYTNAHSRYVGFRCAR